MPRREHNIQNLLPSGYRQLDYIESTGTQWIESGIPIKLDSNNSIEMYCTLSLTDFKGDEALCGGNGNDNASRLVPLSFYDPNRTNPYVGVACYTAGSYSAQPYTYYPQLNTLHDYHTLISLSERYIYVDSNLIARSTLTCPSYNTGYTMPIFGRRWRQQVVDSIPYARLYYLKLIQGTTIYEYIPVLRLSDSKPGLYDIIGGTFKTNSGTGEFLYN